MPKRLIEGVLPLTDLNQVAQKGGGIGLLNAMHPHFARRLREYHQLYSV
ncbi:MAG: hypothetical protein JXA21_27705 [Anaerolineae bacterium]|nr:hypothetical protein [Anaerolineae bacterium]